MSSKRLSESHQEKVREALRHIVEKLGVSKERVAADAGCTVTAVVFWLDGSRSPKAEYRSKIAATAVAAGAPKWVIKALHAEEAQGEVAAP